MMRIAVTGANGFVGQALSQYLADKGHHVVALVRAHRTPAASTPLHPNIQWRPTDLDCTNEIHEALRGCSHVVHLIAKTHSRETPDDLKDYRRTNVDLTLRIATAAAKAEVQRFIYLSSVKAVGETTSNIPIDHTTTPNPTTAYGISKREAEMALQQSCAEAHMELVIVRCPLVYAPHAKGNLATLTKALRLGIPLPLGAINNRRSIVDLTSLCDLLLQCCTQPCATGKTLWATNNQVISTPELIKRLANDHQYKPRLLNISPSWLMRLARLLGKEQALQKLTSSLEIDNSETRELLYPTATTSNLL